MSGTPAWLAAGEALLHRGIQGSMQATALGRRLDATALGVDIDGLTSVRASVTGGRLALAAADPSRESAAHERVNASIKGSPFALLRLAAGNAQPETQAARTAVRGDAEIANSYRE